jgi:hypothetical protein
MSNYFIIQRSGLIKQLTLFPLSDYLSPDNSTHDADSEIQVGILLLGRK